MNADKTRRSILFFPSARSAKSAVLPMLPRRGNIKAQMDPGAPGMNAYRKKTRAESLFPIRAISVIRGYPVSGPTQGV